MRLLINDVLEVIYIIEIVHEFFIIYIIFIHASNRASCCLLALSYGNFNITIVLFIMNRA